MRLGQNLLVLIKNAYILIIYGLFTDGKAAHSLGPIWGRNIFKPTCLATRWRNSAKPCIFKRV